MKAAPRWIGSALILVSVAFLLAAFWEEARRGAEALLGASLWPVLCAIGLYLATVAASAFNWRLLIVGLGQPVGLRTAVEVFFTSQAGKYIPGNVGHLFGRIAFGMARRISGVAIAQSLAVESALTIAAGAIAVVAGLLATEDRLLLVDALLSLPYGTSIPSWLIGGLVIAALLAIVSLLRPIRVRLAKLIEARGTLGFGVSCRFIVIQLLVFAVLGLVLTLSAHSLGLPPLDIGYAVAGSAVAWLVGFITPGAPGGLGVREMLIVACFAPVLGASGALAIALLLRVVTVAGDLIVLVVGLGLARFEGADPLLRSSVRPSL